MATPQRHLRLVETTAEVIPMPRRDAHDPTALAGLQLVADHAVTRGRVIGGWLVRINGKSAQRPEEIVLGAAVTAGLLTWLPDGTGDEIAALTARGDAALAEWTPRGGGDAA